MNDSVRSSLARRLGARSLACAWGVALATAGLCATRLAIVGDGQLGLAGTTVSAQAVAQALPAHMGPGSRARAFAWGDQEVRAFAPDAIVLVQDAAGGTWGADRDRFVPTVRARLAALRARYPKARVALGLPAPVDARTKNEVVPLLRQAAREAGAGTIDLGMAQGRAGDDPAAVAASEIALSLADFRAMKKGWKLVSATSEETDEGPAKNAIDGDPETYWHTRYSDPATKVPHRLTVDLGRAQAIRGFRYVPRQDGGVNGRVRKYEVYTSLDGEAWGTPVAQGEFADTAEPSRIMLPLNVMARYVRFVALTEANGGPWTSMAEFDVIRG